MWHSADLRHRAKVSPGHGHRWWTFQGSRVRARGAPRRCDRGYGGLAANGGIGEGLEWLIGALWGAPEVRVGLGDVVPAGFRVVETYAVLPDARRAKFLIPLDDRRSAAASVASYNALRPPRVRIARAAVGAGIRTGAAAPFLRSRLKVCAPNDASADDLSGWLISEHLRRVFDEPAVHSAIGIGRPGPFRKPVLQAFRPDGSVLGYVKTGWNDVTRSLVRTEAEMLEACAERRPASMLVPKPVHHGAWRDLETVVASPLPLGIRRYRPWRETPPLEATRDVAALFGRRSAPLAAGNYWARTVRRLESLTPRVEQEVATAADAYASDVADRDGGRVLEFGAWHGDWAPWNMARLDDGLVVWDWEHGGRDVPFGFDPLHFQFQLAFIADQLPLHDALARTSELATPSLEALGLSPDRIAATVRLHLLEVFLRYQEAMLAGAGHNPRFFPEVVRILRERTGSGSASAS
jgi:hypothetical protein